MGRQGRAQLREGIAEDAAAAAGAKQRQQRQRRTSQPQLSRATSHRSFFQQFSGKSTSAEAQAARDSLNDCDTRSDRSVADTRIGSLEYQCGVKASAQGQGASQEEPLGADNAPDARNEVPGDEEAS